MSIAATKLNKAGMNNKTLSFGSNKVQLSSSKSASNTTAAKASTVLSTMSSSSSKKTTSLFDSANWVSGVNTHHGIGKYNYNGIRASRNSGIHYRKSTVSYKPQFAQYAYRNANASSSMNGWETATTILNALKTGADIGATIFSKINELNNAKKSNVLAGTTQQSVSNGDRIAAEMNSFNGSDSESTSQLASTVEISNAMSEMKNCNTSLELRQSISKAKSTLKAKQAKLGTNKEKLKAKKEKAETLKDNAVIERKNKTSAKKEASKNVELNETAVESKKEAYKAALMQNKKCTKALADAKANQVTATQAEKDSAESLAKATNSVTEAKKGVADAQANLNNATTDEARAQAQTELAKAQVRLKAAEEEETAAKTRHDKASTDLENAKNAVDTAKTNSGLSESDLAEADAAAKGAEGDLTESQKLLDAKQEDFEDAVKDESEAKGYEEIANTQYEQAEDDLAAFDDMSKLEKAISEAEEKLPEMEEKEKKQYDKYNQKMQDNAKENVRTKNDIRQAERYEEKQDEVLNATYVTQKINEAAGKATSVTLPNGGQTLYFDADGLTITKAEYDALKTDEKV